MASFLVYYGTGEGQTAAVAERVADVLGERGHEATAVDAADAPDDLAVEAYDAVLVGASIHGGSHQPAVAAFVEANRDDLAARPTGFFQVSMSSATEEGEAQAARYVDEFVESTGWHPDRIGLFGGALRFSEYGFLKRFVVKQVARRSMPDLDASRDAEFTDWAEVAAFASDFAAFVEGRLGVPVPAAADTDAD